MKAFHLMVCSFVFFSGACLAKNTDVTCPAPEKLLLESSQQCSENECTYMYTDDSSGVHWESSRQRGENIKKHRKELEFTGVFLLEKSKAQVSCEYQTKGYSKKLRMFAHIADVEKKEGEWKYNKNQNRWECRADDAGRCHFGSSADKK